MPLESPNLDDLTFDRLEAMMRDRIPIVAPDWTDHNESDPGIALIQLFAHMAEQIGYRLNRVPEKTYVEFLKFAGVRLTLARPASTPNGIHSRAAGSNRVALDSGLFEDRRQGRR